MMVGCMLLLHPLYGLAVGGMLGVINFQILGWIAGQVPNPFHSLGWGDAWVAVNYNLIYNPFSMTWMEPIQYIDLIAFGVMVMAIGFEIEYVVHIAHAFLHCEGDGLVRARNALEEMGITVFSAAASTAVQQLVLLFFAQSLAFSIYPKVMMMVIIKVNYHLKLKCNSDYVDFLFLYGSDYENQNAIFVIIVGRSRHGSRDRP